MGRTEKLHVGSMLFLLAVVFLIGSRGCMVSADVAIRAVEASGYTEARVVARHDVFPALSGCGSDDAAGFDVRARNSQGQVVTLLVCSGLMVKAATVRVK